MVEKCRANILCAFRRISGDHRNVIRTSPKNKCKNKPCYCGIVTVCRDRGVSFGIDHQVLRHNTNQTKPNKLKIIYLVKFFGLFFFVVTLAYYFNEVYSFALLNLINNSNTYELIQKCVGRTIKISIHISHISASEMDEREFYFYF